LKILFVDDSATMRKVAEIAFAGEGFEVSLAAGGREVVEAAKTHRPQVVIVDGDMPEVDGYAACKALRADPATATLPVLVVNGPSQPYDEKRATDSGVTDHMDKPFETQALFNKVEALAATKVAPAPAPPSDAAAPAHVLAADKELPSARPKAGSKTVIGLGALGPAPFGEPAPAAKPAARPDAARPRPIAQPVAAKPAAKAPAMPQERPAVAKAAAPAPSPLQALSKLGDQSKTVEERAAELSPEQIEAIRVVAREVIERIVWEVVPDLAESIIKEELAKLLEK
jgi:CheY-like chemotaxis protein